MNPTTRSAVPVGVTAPELGAVLGFEVPLKTSSGEAVNTPENSWNSSAASAGATRFTVIPVEGLALAAYQISPSETWPAVAKAPILVQVLPPRSVVGVIGVGGGVERLAGST